MSNSQTAPYALVVDGDVFILLDACDMLRDAGFRALDTSSVAAAVTQLERHEGDIVLLFTDVQMPGGRDGFVLPARSPSVGLRSRYLSPPAG